MLARFGDTKTPHVAERTAKACLLAPSTEAILQRASRLAEMAATQDLNDWAILYSHVAHGLAQYRRGEYSAAIEACERCHSGDPTGEIWFRAAQAHLVRAMAYFRLGQQEKGVAALDRARGIINSHPLELGPSWHDELICRILLDEAQAMLDGAVAR
jgi:tetratricopeptide (TPR) repeat protein